MPQHSGLSPQPVTAERLMRIQEIIAPNGPIPVGRSTWWAGVKDGRFPKPVKLGPRITVWRAEDIRALVATGRADA